MKKAMDSVVLSAVLTLTSGLSLTYLILATYLYRKPQGIRLPKNVDEVHIDELLDQDTPMEVEAWEAKIARRKLFFIGVAGIAAVFCMTRGDAKDILWTMYCASLAATGGIYLKQKEPKLHWQTTQVLAGVLTIQLVLIAGSTWSRKHDFGKTATLSATVINWYISVTMPRGPPQITRSSYTYPSAKPVPVTSHQVQSSLMDVITFSWLMPVLQDAWTREKLGERSSVDLLSHLPYTSRSFYLSNLFKRSVASSAGASESKTRWSTQHPFFGWHPSFVSGLVWRIYVVHGWTLFVAFLYQVTLSLSTFLPALLTRQFLKALERREQDGDKTNVYLSLAILVLTSAARVALSSQVYTRFNVCEGRLKTQLNSMLYEKTLKLRDASVTSASTGGQSKQANVLNLFSEESGKTAVYPFHVVNTFISLPLEIITGGIALYLTLGLAGFIGLLVPLAFVPFTKILVTKYFKLQREILQAKDKRVSTMNEILASIRFIKFMAHERACEERVMQARRHELALVWKQVRYGIAVNSIGLFGPVFALVASFAFYTKVQNRVLSPADAFSSAIITGILRYSLDGLYGMIPSLAADIASLRRVDAFLSQEELNSRLIAQKTLGDSCLLTVSHVDAAWANALPPFLHDINCKFEEGVNLIVGPLGSGKTLLLLALLGESVISKGEQSANSPESGKSFPNGNGCALAPQSPWLVNGSVRDNILFGAQMEEARYQDVLHACSLLPDLELFADYDQTQIGEKGVILSGGQKARVGLARALYSPATFLFLDDVLSAVDSHTAQHIIKYCLSGHLVEKRMIVLVSHQVQLCLASAATVLHLDHGTVKYTGTAQDYSSSSLYASLLQVLDDSHVTLGTESTGADDAEEKPLGKRRGDSKAKQVTESKALVVDEGKGVGDIGLGVWMFWARSNGGVLFWLAVPLVWASSRGSLVLIDYWTSRWTDHNVASAHPQNESSYYIGVSLALCLLAMIPNLMRWPLVYFGSMRLSRIVYADMLHAVLRSPMRWFDTNLLGRLYNRFGHDIQVIDVELSKLVGSTAISIINVLFTIIAVTAVSAWAFLIVVPVGICWIYYGRLYKVAARDFRRLDAVNKSPLFSLYSETVTGAVIIRAFGASKRFLVESHHRNDASQMFMFLNWYLNRWLGFRFELLSVCLTAAAGLFVVLKKDMPPGLAGFTLAVVQKGGTDMMWLFRQLTYAEVAMVSVERLQEYTQLPSEPDTPAEQVPASWPERGEISVEGLSVRYAPGLPQILKDVSFRAAAGQKIGIVGATGSGKSTLALSFFRFVTADAGQIMIDGVDTSKISLYDLRSRLSIVPQEPTILSGTLRNTLDPLAESYSDLEMYDALRRVHLLKDENSRQDTIFSNLDSHISEQGKNLSAGEKQLLCLARAILRKSKIVLLDEATSSVDFETDQLVTNTLAEEFSDCTMLVIAHRLRTIIGFDKVLVMHNGEVAEFDSPRVLLADSNTRFYGLCQAAGTRELAALQAAVARNDS